MTQILQASELQIKPIPFVDLQAQQNKIRPQIDAAIKRVLDHSIYIMGPEVFTLEKELAAFCGVKHAISCANGTDALGMALMAKNVKPGDAVFVPSFTFAATAEVVVWQGATPVFIDSLPDTYNIDPQSLEQGILAAKKAGLNCAGIIPVDIFGQPADYDAIQVIADAYGLWVIADAAQSFGATYKNRKVGNIGDIATTSFFPAKPLGCYGDGGAIFTNDDAVADMLRSIRVHGQGTDKYDNVRIGLNGRLDTLQAAILLEKLKVFPEELVARQSAADIYTAGLEGLMQLPNVLKNCTSAWAQYTVKLTAAIDRAQLTASLKQLGIPTAVYYVKPLHQQTAYKNYLTATSGSLPVCEALAEQVLSLPMSGYMDKSQITYIVESMDNILRDSI